MKATLFGIYLEVLMDLFYRVIRNVTINTIEIGVNTRISPLLIYFLDVCIGTNSRGALNGFLAVGHIPVEIVLLVSYFFDATHPSNRIFLWRGQENFR